MDFISKVKPEPTNSQHLPTPSPPSSPQPTTKVATKRRSASPPPLSQPNKRGRKPGASSSSFTKDQDTYITQLRQNGKNNTEVHRLFEEKFNTGRNAKSIENRWFTIKDEVLLSDWEDNLLLQAIKEIENDMSGAIIRRFKELSNGKTVTKGYVMKKMKGKRTTSATSQSSAPAVTTKAEPLN
ncbi:hypothetical protein TWF730_010190 [Orbilia blumenaviensis]|uniref:Uncharacterized protein n=1 Tax=Orbilia blumenaviensis TaxID=1796055 RepID=A0AAV9UR09_9PEZI